MSLHILIDGYNLIRQSEGLAAMERASLQEGREALLERLASYKRIKHHPITVVFDGTHAHAPLQGRTRYKGINVIFSRPGELADTVIKRLVTRERERAVVVSSDKEIADFATVHGSVTMDSVAFENKMQWATQVDPTPGDFSQGDLPGWTPTTKKKGPSRRPPKQKRKSRSRTRKL
jgi:predicted RNA-binding protein with PIN domain